MKSKYNFFRSNQSSRRLLYSATLTGAMLFTHVINAMEPVNGAVSSSTTQSHSGQLIVKFKNSGNLTTQSLITNKLSSLTISTGNVMRSVRKTVNGADVVKVTAQSLAELEDLAAQIALDPSVEYAEPDLILHAMFTPNDTRYNEQWHYYEATGGLNLPQAWDITSGQGAVVAVVDTGYRPHADLAANILPGYDLISDIVTANDGDGRDSDALDPGDSCNGSGSSWHGTHVAGSVAAVTNNGIGVAGIAYNAKIVPVRVLGACGGTTSDIAVGIEWAAGLSVAGIPTNLNPANVINMSLGAQGSCGATLQNAINNARNAGVTVVVAAGNSSADAVNFTPANCNGVITVAATGRTGSKAFYSNFGTVVEVAAPGGDTSTGSMDGILSTLNSGATAPGSDSYAYYQGTSMAAPQVAGVSALLYSVNPNITPASVENILISTARAFPGACNGCGAGIVDALAAVQAANGTTPPSPPPSQSNVLQNGVTVTNLAANTGGELHFTIDIPANSVNLKFAISGGTGDSDLYIKFGAPPTLTDWDQRPYMNGNNETVNINNAQVGTYYVMLQGYSSFSGVSLIASYDAAASPGGDILQNGVTVTNLSGAQNSETQFTMDVPTGVSSLSFSISGGSGDADIYVRYGAPPTLSLWDVRPWINGNNETAVVNNIQAGTYYIMVQGYTSFSGVNLVGNYQ